MRRSCVQVTLEAPAGEAIRLNAVSWSAPSQVIGRGFIPAPMKRPFKRSCVYDTAIENDTFGVSLESVSQRYAEIHALMRSLNVSVQLIAEGLLAMSLLFKIQ